MKTIFVSIVAYRGDSYNILSTINNLLSKAANPERIRIGICYQNDEYIDFKQIKNVKHIVHASVDEEFGVTRSRSLLKDMVTSEDFFLQIDSHSDFTQNWDFHVIDDFERVSRVAGNNIIFSSRHFRKYDIYDKEIKYEYRENDKDLPLLFHNLTYLYGIPKIDISPFYSDHKDIFDKNKVHHLIKTQFLSAHFIFAGQNFIKNFRMSNYINFFGEEPELSLRLFCEGFDIYNYYDRAIVIHDDKKSWHVSSYNTEWINPVEFRLYNDKEEVAKLFRHGKNSFVSVNNLARSLDDFFNFHMVPEHRKAYNFALNYSDEQSFNKLDDSPGHGQYKSNDYFNELSYFNAII